MSYAPGCVDELRQPCHDIRQPIAGVLAAAEAPLWGLSGRVTIGASARAARVLLAVEDDGPGFGGLPRDFGCGLAAVAREAVEHRGRLECGRGSLGGARVNLWLPAVAPGMGGCPRMRLVLCDDNRILCEALAFVLRAHGHRVLGIATRASEGVAAVSLLEPDACLLDVRLPDGSGIDAAQAMRQRNPETKVVVLSSLDDPSVVSEAKKAGVVGFLRKDQKLDAIVRVVEAVGAGGIDFDPATSRPQGRRMKGECRDYRHGALTRRETEVLRRIVAGQGTRTMAIEMGVTINTLRSYVKSILTKLGVHSRLEAAAIASEGQHRSVV